MKKFKEILVTGGAGFIGGALIRNLLKNTECLVHNIDKISYASDFTGINELESSKHRHFHYKIDLKDKDKLEEIIKKICPQVIIHLAAESHVDRSIENPSNFIQSNIIGTFNLLEAARDFWSKLSPERKNSFRFHHVSTDEVFGSLNHGQFFNESSNYSPRSPYSASKASSDHLVQSWHNTYGLPTLISNCSNNYGPYQFPEKLIPLTIKKALAKEKIPIYGNGKNIRDWLYVDDHVDAIFEIIQKGEIGKNYCIGGNQPLSNLEMVEKICCLLDMFAPINFKYKTLINFVRDRPGHDKRYAIDNNFIKENIGWEPKNNIDFGLEKTVKWYINNLNWCELVMKKGNYYGNRLGN